MRVLWLTLAVLATIGLIATPPPSADAAPAPPDPWLTCTLSVPPRCEVNFPHPDAAGAG